MDPRRKLLETNVFVKMTSSFLIGYPFQLLVKQNVALDLRQQQIRFVATVMIQIVRSALLQIRILVQNVMKDIFYKVEIVLFVMLVALDVMDQALVDAQVAVLLISN